MQDLKQKLPFLQTQSVKTAQQSQPVTDRSSRGNFDLATVTADRIPDQSDYQNTLGVLD